MAQKQKTAVGWLIEQLEEHLLAENVVLNLKNTEAYELAIDMEREQLIMAYNTEEQLPFDKWYNQTFNP